MCVRDRMKVDIRAEWLINVNSLILHLLQYHVGVTTVIIHATRCKAKFSTPFLLNTGTFVKISPFSCRIFDYKMFGVNFLGSPK
jgi:hypothetical protein